MGIDMYLEQSQLQSSSVATMCQSQVEAYQDLQSAIQKFSEDTESLKSTLMIRLEVFLQVSCYP